MVSVLNRPLQKIKNMKKLILLFVVAIGFASTGNTQVNSNAIGARFGYYSSFGSGVEVSYQKGLSEKNRIELDLGVHSRKDWGGFGLAAIYHWNWNIVSGLNWYIGPGASISMFNHRNKSNSYIDFGIGGQIGIEFDFQEIGAPILVSLDSRPMWSLTRNNYYNDRFGYGTAVSIRYIF